MSNKLKILVIGGQAAGISTATRIRRLNEEAEILLIEKSSTAGYSLASLPYFICDTITNKENLTNGTEERLINLYNIKLLKHHEAVKINQETRTVTVKNLSTELSQEISFDRLILATGNKIQHPKINTKNYQNVFSIKNIDQALSIKSYIEKTAVKDISIIGCNHIGLTLADCLHQKGFNITLIEEGIRLFPQFDEEFNYIIKEELHKIGIKVCLGMPISKLIKNDNNIVQKIELTGKMSPVIPTHMVILCSPLVPNTNLAANSDISLGMQNGIIVNNEMMTNQKYIFAVGGCTEIINSITGKTEINPLLNVVQQQGRVAGSNAINEKQSYPGFIGTRYLHLNKLQIGITGISLENALENGINASETTIFNGSHERFIAGGGQIHLKVVYDTDSKKLLGAQICGKCDGVTRRLDVLATAINAGMTVTDLANLDLCYAPEISTYKDIVNLAGMVAENRVSGLSQAVKFSEIEINEDVVILDIRNKQEYTREHIMNTLWIPMNEIRSRLNEIPKNKKIYIYGHAGLRGYLTERILKSNGYENVFNIDGGISSIKILENII